MENRKHSLLRLYWRGLLINKLKWKNNEIVQCCQAIQKIKKADLL